MGKIRNSIQLARSSWEVLKADKELLLLPVISGIACLLVAASFVIPLFAVGEPTTGTFVGLFVMYFVLSYITIFFNAALISAANERLEGGDPTVRSAIRGAARHAGRIVPWALLSALVSIILRTLEERLDFVGRIIVAMLGLAWSVITFLVLPVIVIEGVGTGKAFTKSRRMVQHTWGENLGGHIGLTLIGLLLIIPGVGLLVFGFTLGGLGGYVIGLGILWIIVVGVILTAMTAVYQTALYRFAVNRPLPSDYFDASALQEAFYPRRRFGWRR